MIAKRLTESETDKAAVLAAYIDCSPHEWPKGVADIALICHGLLDLRAQAAKDAALIAELTKDKERLAKALEPFGRAFKISMEPFEAPFDNPAWTFLPRGWPTVGECKVAYDLTRDSIDRERNYDD